MKVKKKKPDMIIRVGDKVVIRNPQIFVRCGYPKTIADMMQEVEKEWLPKVQKFLKSLDFQPTHEYSKALLHYGGVQDGVVRALAYGKLKKIKFGGQHREIYTELNERYKNQEFEVKGIRFVKTGTYHSGSYSCGYDGDGDYDPPYLSSEKTHKILLVSHTLGKYGGVEIEARNVEKI